MCEYEKNSLSLVGCCSDLDDHLMQIKRHTVSNEFLPTFPFCDVALFSMIPNEKTELIEVVKSAVDGQILQFYSLFCFEPLHLQN